jgi:glycosyltransferase involved in cell wall biosynthesis
MIGRPSLLAVCTVAPWPVRNGYSLRVANLLRELAGRWSIVLIAPPAEPPPLTISTFIAVALGGRGATYPWRFDQTQLRDTVVAAVRAHHPERALVWPGAEAVWFGRRDLPPAVLDVIDCNPLEFWRGFTRYRGLRQRYRALREIPIATWFARRAAHAFAASICVGEADARWQRRIGGASVTVIPNGVDVPRLGRLPPEAERPTVCFTGALDYRPNVEAVLFAVEWIWPRVVAAVPEARFLIAGRDPASVIRALSTRPGIEILANVPDMATVIGQSWAALAPMRSGVGIKNKILEAWACARPAAMTRLATNGLTLPPDHTPLVRDSGPELADVIIDLLRHPDQRHRLGLSARDHVSQHFTWAGAAARVDALLRAAGDERSGPRE